MTAIVTAVLEKLAETWLGSWISGFFGTRPKAAAPDPAARAATAETELAQEQTANEIVDQAAAVRTSADARVMLESAQPSKADPASAAGAAGTGPAPVGRSALDDDPEGHWRD